MATTGLQNVDSRGRGAAKLTTSEPFVAVVTWASQPVDLHETVSLLAVEVLREVYEVSGRGV